MSVLQRFEKRLEGLVEGAFAKVFKGVVHPVEILNAMQREAEAHKAILAGGRTLVPNRYVIDLSPVRPQSAGAVRRRAGPGAGPVAGGVHRRAGAGRSTATSSSRSSGATGWTPACSGSPPRSTPAARSRRCRPGGYDAAAGLPAVRPGRRLRPPPGHGAARRNVRLVSGDGRTYPLQMGSTVIGRGDQANLRLPDVGISRRHARLDFDGGQVVLTDLGSTNGTMVNGQRVSAVALNPGDMIQLGTTTLTFRVDG